MERLGQAGGAGCELRRARGIAARDQGPVQRAGENARDKPREGTRRERASDEAVVFWRDAASRFDVSIQYHVSDTSVAK